MVFEKLVSLTVFQSSFLLFVKFDILLGRDICEWKFLKFDNKEGLAF